MAFTVMDKRIKYGVIFLSSLITTLAIYGYFTHSTCGKPALLQRPSIPITAKALIHSFDQNETFSDHKYLYKILSVRGQIKQIRQEEGENYTVFLENDPRQGASVKCTLDSMYLRLPLSLKTGDSVTLRGTCAGRLMDIALIECILEK
jgi:hypothetical protein